MARPGRKRKFSTRERNGRAKRARKAELIEERVRIARSQPHRRELKSNDRASELAELALGRLSLRHVISKGERAAGEAFAGIVGRYRSIIEGPRPVRSLALATSAAPGDSADEEELAERFDCPSQHFGPIEQQQRLGREIITTRLWPCQQPGEVCACAQRRARYMRAYEAIAGVGRRALLAVISVAVRGEDLAPQELVYLRAGLRAAQRHLGLQDIDRP